MANKSVKDLKKGDIVRSPVTDGRDVYLAWCKVINIEDISIWKPASKMETLRLTEFQADGGKFKGSKFPAYLPENAVVIIPNRPNKILRVWQALTSN